MKTPKTKTNQGPFTLDPGPFTLDPNTNIGDLHAMEDNLHAALAAVKAAQAEQVRKGQFKITNACVADLLSESEAYCLDHGFKSKAVVRMALLILHESAMRQMFGVEVKDPLTQNELWSTADYENLRRICNLIVGSNLTKGVKVL